QFWATVKAKTVTGEVQLQALIDGKKVIITKSTARKYLQLEDAEGVDCLPNAAIFEQLTLIGYEKISQKLTFYKAFFSPQWRTKRKDTELPQTSGPTTNVADEAVNEEMDDSLVRAATTASSLEAEQDNGNINKTQSKATTNELGSQGTSSGGGPRCQETMRDTISQTRSENISKFFNDSLLAGVNTPQSDEDRLKLNELMELCTNLQKRVIDLEQTKTSQALEIDSLKRRNQERFNDQDDTSMFDANTDYKKPVQATKGTIIKTKAKVDKSDKKKQPAKKPKAKGLDVLSKVPDDQQQKTSGTYEGIGTIPGVPDVPIYDYESDKESWGDSDEEDDDENNFDDDSDDNDESDDKRTESDRDEIPDPNLTNIHDEENVNEEEEDEVTKELYDDVNMNLGNKDTEMTYADQGGLEQQNDQSGFEQEKEDSHVTLTLVLDTQKTGGIPKITSSFTTPTPLPPLFFNPLSQQATPTLTPTASESTTSPSLPALPDFTSVFKFNEKVTNLEKDLSEIKQVDKYAQALSSITAIVDRYMDNKLKEAINKAIQAYNFDSAVLTRSSSQPQSSYEAAATLSEFELTKILINKMEKNKSFDVADYKKELYDALVKSYNTDKDIFESYGEVFSLKRSRDDKNKDRDPSAGLDQGTKRRKSSKDVESSRDSRSKEKKTSSTFKGMQQDQEFITGENDEQPADKEISQVAHAEEPPISSDELNDSSFDFYAFVINRLNIPNLTHEILVGPAFNLLKGTCKSITELEYHIEECSKATTERLDWHNPKNNLYPFDIRKPIPLIQDQRGRQIIPKDYFINKDLEYLKGRDLSRKYSTSVTKTKAATYELKWIEDLVTKLWSPMQRKRLMHTAELHKFSDGTFNDVRSALRDIVVGIRMEYLPMRKWSNLDKKRARVMVQDIDKKLYQRRLMRNLEKFIGGRVYGNDLRLLERTI
nr:hypothetical protein [Tanacetum cinerariifolium]